MPSLEAIELLDVLLSHSARWVTGPGGNTLIAEVSATSFIMKEAFLDSVGCSSCDAFVRDGRLYVKVTFHQSRFHVTMGLKVTRAFLEVLYDNDEKFHLKYNLHQMFSMFRNILTWDETKLIPGLKYCTAFFLAKYLRNDLPEPTYEKATLNPYLFSKKIRSYLRQRIVCSNNRNLKLMWSILQGVKRGAEKADESYIKASCEKHARAMVKDGRSDDPSFLANFTIKSSQIFRRFRPTEGTYEYSSNACYQASRKEDARAKEDCFSYGARGYMIDKYLRCGLGVIEYQLLDMVEVSPGCVREARGFPKIPSDWLSEGVLESHARVVAVLEPLKVRLITAGPAETYALSQSFQKSLFRYLKKYPQFELVGSPLDEDKIYRMMDREGNFPDMEFESFVSGDYSGATDSLKMCYTKAGLETAMGSLTDPVLRKALYSHIIHYDDGSQVVQTNGQLMGSILSFPFLCTTNLIGYWISLERYLDRSIRFEDLPCLINGDDILFRTNQEHYAVWKQIVNKLGFELSVGKNYIHRTVLTINSQCFTYHSTRLREHIYHNVGFLYGESKLSRGAIIDQIENDPGKQYERVIQGACNKVRAHQRFLFYNRPIVDRLSDKGRFNLHIPVSHGGVGWKKFPEISSLVTRSQSANYWKMERELTEDTFTYRTVQKRVFGFRCSNSGNTVLTKVSRNSLYFLDRTQPLREFERLARDLDITYVNSGRVYQPKRFLWTMPRDEWYSVPERFYHVDRPVDFNRPPMKIVECIY